MDLLTALKEGKVNIIKYGVVPFDPLQYYSITDLDGDEDDGFWLPWKAGNKFVLHPEGVLSD